MLLIRHAESEWNRVFGASRVDPGLPDPAITGEGAAAARVAAAALTSSGIARIVASPYRRTLQTAEILAEALGLGIEVEPLVRERCAFTCDQGTPRSRLAVEWPDLELSALEERWWGSTIESWDSMERRGMRFLELARAHGLRERTIVVTHWGFIRCVSGHEVGNLQTIKLTFDGHGTPAPTVSEPTPQEDS